MHHSQPLHSITLSLTENSYAALVAKARTRHINQLRTFVDPKNKLNEVILSKIPNVGLHRKYEEEC